MCLNKRLWPVFLVGCHRSGTTLARYILDAHPNIACPPESKFISGLYALQGHPHWLPALTSLRLGREEVIAELGLFTRRIFDAYTLKRNKQRWVDKTPNYYKILPFINDLFSNNVLFLFMVRHPLDNIISLNEFFRYPTAATQDDEVREIVRRYGIGLHCWARYWNDVYEAIAIFAESYPDRSNIFRYEDLVRDPAKVSSAILDFIGEDFESSLIEKALTTDHDVGFQDHKILTTRRIHTDSIDRWKELNSQAISTIWEIVAPVASLFGYKRP